MIGRIVIGLVMVALGFGMVWKTRTIIDFFGTSSWAEVKLGGGGTSLLYKLIGVAVCFVGFMVATNLWQTFLEATLGRLFVPAGR